jgi:hypothetical protein
VLQYSCSGIVTLDRERREVHNIECLKVCQIGRMLLYRDRKSQYSYLICHAASLLERILVGRMLQ